MALPLLSKVRVMAGKIEGTYGTAEALANTDAGIRFYGRGLEILGETIAREAQGSLGTVDGVVGPKSITGNFSVLMNGKGSAGVPNWAALVLPCSGFGLTSQTYALTNTQSNWKSCTLGHYIDGRRKLGRGCMFNWTMRLTNGAPGIIEVTALGGYSAKPSATAILTGMTYESTKPPTFSGSGSITIDSGSYPISGLTLELGAQLALRQDANAAGGYLGAWIGDIRPIIRIDPEASAVGTKDWAAIHEAGTEVAISAVLNGGSNNTITISTSSAQLSNYPGDGDRDGKLIEDMVFMVNDNDLSIAFS